MSDTRAILARQYNCGPKAPLILILIVALTLQWHPYCTQAAAQLAPAPAPLAGATEPTPIQPKPVDDLVWQRFLQWKQNPLFVPPFDSNVLALPEVQLAFLRSAAARDLVLFREILNEAIESRRKFAPSVKLMFKYTGKLLGRFIRSRREDLALPERVEPSPAFFTMLAELTEKVINRSALLKAERAYTKDNINTEAFRARVEALFDNIERILNAAPMGGYLRWDAMRLFADQPQNPRYNGDLAEEASDLVAVSARCPIRPSAPKREYTDN